MKKLPIFYKKIKKIKKPTIKTKKSKLIMGIYKLMSLLQEKAPDCIKRNGIEVFSGRTIACDASMVLFPLFSYLYLNFLGYVSILSFDSRLHQ